MSSIESRTNLVNDIIICIIKINNNIKKIWVINTCLTSCSIDIEEISFFIYRKIWCCISFELLTIHTCCRIAVFYERRNSLICARQTSCLTCSERCSITIQESNGIIICSTSNKSGEYIFTCFGCWIKEKWIWSRTLKWCSA